jgi:hypothetical protein
MGVARPFSISLWAVKAMRQKQRTEDEKVVYLSCPCSERLWEIKAVLQQAGFVVIYASRNAKDKSHRAYQDGEFESRNANIYTVEKMC